MKNESDFVVAGTNSDTLLKTYRKATIRFRVRLIGTILSFSSLLSWLSLAVFGYTSLFMVFLLLGAVAGIISCPYAIPRVTLTVGNFWHDHVPMLLVDLLGYPIGFGWILGYSVFTPFIVAPFGLRRGYKEKQELRLSLKINGIPEPNKKRDKTQWKAV